MAATPEEKRRLLVITGDDYGYWPSYNRGILEAVEMGALDRTGERRHTRYWLVLAGPEGQGFGPDRQA